MLVSNQAQTVKQFEAVCEVQKLYQKYILGPQMFMLKTI